MRFNARIDRKIKMYQECPIKFDGADKMIENGKSVIIDFDRYDFGDPWEEFNRIVWCTQKSPVFATGIVDGYFDNEVPLAFWKLLALYISSNMRSSIPWAIPFGDDEIRTMLEQAKDVLAWYDEMRNPIPTWYHRDI